MIEQLETTIKALVKRAENASESLDSFNFSQAALCITNALVVLTDAE